MNYAPICIQILAPLMTDATYEPLLGVLHNVRHINGDAFVGRI